MTMSLSLARPIVADPGGFSGVPAPGQNRLDHLRGEVARLGGLLIAGGPSEVSAGCAAAAPTGGCRVGGGALVGRRSLAGPWYIGCGGAGGAPGYARGAPAGWPEHACRGPGCRGVPASAGAPQAGRPIGRRASTRFAAAGRPPRVVADLERKLWPVGIADVDALAVVDVDHRHPAAVDVGAVQRTVVDGQPAPLIEAQQQMSTRDQRMRDAHVGAQIAPDHHVMACGEGALRSVVSDCQHGRCCLTHRHNLSCSAQCTDCDTSGAPASSAGRIGERRRARRLPRSGCGCRWSACTGCSACTPSARCARRRRPRSG